MTANCMPGIPGTAIIMPCCGIMPGGKPNPCVAMGFPGMPICMCGSGAPVGGGPGTGCPGGPTAAPLSGGPGTVLLLEAVGPVLPWLSCNSNFRIRAVSTADGLVPVMGPSATIRCCSSPGTARNMTAARWSMLFSWMNTATGSGPGGYPTPRQSAQTLLRPAPPHQPPSYPACPQRDFCRLP